MSNRKPAQPRKASTPLAKNAPAGALKAPHATDPTRWADGTLRPGNTAALVHGARSRQASALQAGLRHELRAQVLADLGGDESSLAVTLLRLVDRFVETSLLGDAYFTWLQDQGGPIGTRGRQRAAVSGYFAALDRQLKLALEIGLERRGRSVSSMSFSDYVTRSDGASGRTVSQATDRGLAAAVHGSEPAAQSGGHPVGSSVSRSSEV